MRPGPDWKGTTMTTTTLPRLTRCARVADVPAELAAAFRCLPHYRATLGRDSVGGYDPLSTEGPNRADWHLDGFREVGRTGLVIVYVLRFERAFAAVTVNRGTGFPSFLVGDGDPQTRAYAEEKAAAALAAAQVTDPRPPRDLTGKTIARVEQVTALTGDDDEPGPAVNLLILHFTDGTHAEVTAADGPVPFRYTRTVAEAECKHCGHPIYRLDGADPGEWVSQDRDTGCSPHDVYRLDGEDYPAHAPIDGSERKAA